MLAKKQIEWSLSAQADLSDIYALIVKDNPQAAEQVVNFVIASVATLMSFPLIGRMGGKSKTRELVLNRYPYTIVYRVSANTIRIVTIVHQSKCYP